MWFDYVLRNICCFTVCLRVKRDVRGSSGGLVAKNWETREYNCGAIRSDTNFGASSNLHQTFGLRLKEILNIARAFLLFKLGPIINKLFPSQSIYNLENRFRDCARSNNIYSACRLIWSSKSIDNATRESNSIRNLHIYSSLKTKQEELSIISLIIFNWSHYRFGFMKFLWDSFCK